jgi:hypothetical protein
MLTGPLLGVMFVYSVAVTYEVRMRQELEEFVRIFVIGCALYSSGVIHRWHR